MEDLNGNKEVQTIGEMLKNARIKQNKTIDEIADELCIRQFYLTAIEEMDFENIPPMPYGLGFVRSYAKLLGLNSDRIVFAYRQILTGEKEPEPLYQNQQTEKSTPRLKHFLLVILGLALLAAAWSVLPTNAEFEDATEENTITLPEPVIVSEEQENKAVAEEVATEQNDEDADKDDSASVEKEKKADSAENKTEETKETKAAEAEKEVKADTKEEEKQAEKAVLPKMRIVLTGPSWLELRQGRKVLLNGVYNKGYKYDLPSAEGLIITVGRPRNVQFYVNDKLTQVVTNIKRKNVSLDSYFKTQD